VRAYSGKVRRMSKSVPTIGMDFGTTNSSMAWCDPRTQRAEIIKHQGEDKTSSMEKECNSGRTEQPSPK
jgi:molecular chaperone DnaK (HSP70)